MDWITTSSILYRLREFDDERAWGAFVDRFRGPIVRFARSLGVSAVGAEDVAQEALLAFARDYSAGRYDRRRGRLSHWLFGIAYRRCLAERRRDVGRAEPLPDADVLAEQSATDLWVRHWERSLALACIERARGEFDPKIFAAFERVVQAERSPEEAAQELGVTVKAVYNAKHRVLKRIRQLRDAYEQLDEQ